MRFSARSAAPILSILAVAGAVGQLTLSSGLQRNFGASERLCKFYVCDDATVVTYAYQEQLKGDRNSLSTAIYLLRDALLRDPASALRWSDLGDAYADAGQIDQARTCFDRAVIVGHTSSRILISAGDFHLRYGDRLRGIRYLNRTLTLTSERDRNVFAFFVARSVGVQEVLSNGFPIEARPAQFYLRYLMEESMTADARKVWNWMMEQHLADRRAAMDYSNYLVAQKLYAEAADAWASGVAERAGYRTRQFVYNGDFEQEFVVTPFDWTIFPSRHVEVSRDSQAHAGQFSLHLHFDGGENTDFSQVSQTVVLRPGRYRLQAYVRSDKLTTDEGVSLQIVDPEAPARLTIDTPQTRGTTGWHLVTSTFALPPGTRLALVRVHRRPAWKFDNQIKGDVWVDQVSLTPLE